MTQNTDTVRRQRDYFKVYYITKRLKGIYRNKNTFKDFIFFSYQILKDIIYALIKHASNKNKM